MEAGPPMGPGRTLVLALFYATLLLLPLHLGVILLRGTQPWPAIVLPFFQGAPPSAETISVHKPTLRVFFVDAPPAELSVHRFLDVLPRSHHTHFMMINFAPEAESEPAAGRTRYGTSLETWPEARTAWVHRRLQHLFPDRTPVGMNVVWVQQTHRIQEARSTTSTTPVDTLHLDLR